MWHTGVSSFSWKVSQAITWLWEINLVYGSERQQFDFNDEKMENLTESFICLRDILSKPSAKLFFDHGSIWSVDCIRACLGRSDSFR